MALQYDEVNLEVGGSSFTERPAPQAAIVRETAHLRCTDFALYESHRRIRPSMTA